MSGKDVEALAAVVKYVILPAIGFAAGFLAKWFLQSTKSRDELLRELAPQRAEALHSLWATTTLPPEVASLKDDDPLPSSFRQNADRAIVDWYTKQSGGPFLSWQATQLLFRLLDVLRDSASRKAKLEDAVSLLRTRLKRDCGPYSAWESTRRLVRPRRSPWPVNPAADKTSHQTARSPLP